MTCESFFSAAGAQLLGSAALIIGGGGLFGAAAWSQRFDYNRYSDIFANCCQNLTQPITKSCIALVGDLAQDLDEMAELCEKIPDKKSSEVFNMIMFGALAAVTVGAGLYLGARAFYNYRHRSEYTQLNM